MIDLKLCRCVQSDVYKLSICPTYYCNIRLIRGLTSSKSQLLLDTGVVGFARTAFIHSATFAYTLELDWVTASLTHPVLSVNPLYFSLGV